MICPEAMERVLLMVEALEQEDAVEVAAWEAADKEQVPWDLAFVLPVALLFLIKQEPPAPR